MKKKTKLILGIFIIILITIFCLNIDVLGYRGSIALESQLNEIISQKDINKMKEISKDNYSFSFLSGLPKEEKVDSTSDMQGGTDELYFYMATVNGHDLEVTMKRKTRVLIGPKYEIEKVQVLQNK
ncbi:hypothetical protein [Paenibacillus lautus]|uniref:hypothetical protein n=1 Tax=Paenibacillus lautus TaxID=1401 RepID=UPI003D2CA02C